MTLKELHLPDNSELVAAKKDLVSTTATPGWYAIQRFAEAIVQGKERAAIDEEDDTRGNALRREAKAARSFMNELFERIEKAKQYDTPTDDTFMSIVHEPGFETLFLN